MFVNKSEAHERVLTAFEDIKVYCDECVMFLCT